MIARMKSGIAAGMAFSLFLAVGTFAPVLSSLSAECGTPPPGRDYDQQVDVPPGGTLSYITPPGGPMDLTICNDGPAPSIKVSAGPNSIDLPRGECVTILGIPSGVPVDIKNTSAEPATVGIDVN